METTHTWEKLEIVLEASRDCPHPYTEVEVWVDLQGPGFSKRVFGFWDGGRKFCVRVVATAPGKWSWTSGANVADAGLAGISGSFDATQWSEAEKQENPNRRGFVVASANGHALQYADGTPFFLLGDTWWSVPTFRYRWYDDERERLVGPEMGFKDMVRYRKRQGYNCIAMIAAFPAWANDGLPHQLIAQDADKTMIRSAWRQAGTQSAEDMHNEGGRPFAFPGRVPGFEQVYPDVDRINPGYFRHMDRKIDYLNAQGFVPFIEAARRDASQAWRKYYEWPGSYARFIRYVFSRYQANSVILSPIHFDWDQGSIPSRAYNEPANLVVEKHGPPPFGTLVSSNAHYSNYRNFGGPDEAKWLTLYQTGNRREHVHAWYLTEIFRLPSPRPALNGEPYYDSDPNGWPYRKRPSDRVEEALYCRSGMYASVLSGGLAGHIYGAMGLWQGSIEEAASPKMWEALTWKSADQMRHLRTFVMARGARYQDLVPDPELVTPCRTGDPNGYKGWACCAGTAERDFFLLYFEKEYPDGGVFRGGRPGASYSGRWFDPRLGSWQPIAGLLTTDPATGRIALPSTPSNDDWGLTLELA